MKLFIFLFALFACMNAGKTVSRHHQDTNNLYLRHNVDYPFCPTYYKYCTTITVNFHNLLTLDELNLDLGITDITIKKEKTYRLNYTYLSEFEVSYTFLFNVYIFPFHIYFF